MSLRKLRFSVFVIKTYSGTGKRDFNLGLCFCFFRFCSLPRALTSALIIEAVTWPYGHIPRQKGAFTLSFNQKLIFC